MVVCGKCSGRLGFYRGAMELWVTDGVVDGEAFSGSSSHGRGYWDAQ